LPPLTYDDDFTINLAELNLATTLHFSHLVLKEAEKFLRQAKMGNKRRTAQSFLS